MCDPLNAEVMIMAGWVGGWNLLTTDFEDLQPLPI
jgi:hypothetical protein